MSSQNPISSATDKLLTWAVWEDADRTERDLPAAVAAFSVTDPHRDILTQLSRIGAWRASRAWSTCFMLLNRCTDNRKLPSRYAASIPLSAS
jgi:hypothetical protein